MLETVGLGGRLKHYPHEIAEGLFTVPHEDPEALADKIIWLYNHPEERNKNAKTLYDFVTKNLTWDIVSKEIRDIIYYDKKFN